MLLLVSINSSKFHVPKYFLGYITSQQVFRIKSGGERCGLLEAVIVYIVHSS